jgi:hypothetical protein
MRALSECFARWLDTNTWRDPEPYRARTKRLHLSAARLRDEGSQRCACRYGDVAGQLD